MNQFELVIVNLKIAERLHFYRNKLQLSHVNHGNTSTFIFNHQSELNRIVQRLWHMYMCNLQQIQWLNQTYYEYLNI